MKIFPIPQKIKFSGTYCDLSKKTWIILPENSGFPLKQRIMEAAKEIAGNFIRQPRVCAGHLSGTEILAVMRRNSSVAPEGYRLTVTKAASICIEASDDAGFFYGMQTACQLLEKPSECPCCEICDKPSLQERGYMLDVSRDKIPTMDTLKKIVKSLALLRYNSLQLYMEHTFSFANHERVWADYTPFTSEEIMELDEYCHDHFIELVPNLNSFGHLERWLCHSKYKSLAECDPPYIHPANNCPMQGVLCPSKESLDFMDSLYAEFLPNFTSRKVNIGCDETVELGKGKSKKKCETKGTQRVYLDFLNQLAERAKAHGCSVEFWGDIIMQKPELIETLPQGIVALEWGYEADHPFEKDTLLFKQSGVDFLVCPGTSSWNTILGRTTNMIDNISNAIFYGCKNGAKGMLLTDWGDKGHHQYYPISWPGIAMGGGTSWNADTKATASELAYGISFAFSKGKEGVRLGEFIMKMGRVYDDFSVRVPNATAFGFIMTMYEELHYSKDSSPSKNYKMMRCPEIKKAMIHTKKLLAELTHSPFIGFELENRELENALYMALASMMFLYRAVGGAWDKEEWKDIMHHVISQHEQLWLARNRSGGLYESSSYLRKFLKSNPLDWKKR